MITSRLDHRATTSGDRPFFHYGEDDVRACVFCSNPMVSALVMFGVWKAGAAFCPVNFAYTGRLRSYQLNDTQPAARRH